MYMERKINSWWPQFIKPAILFINIEKVRLQNVAADLLKMEEWIICFWDGEAVMKWVTKVIHLWSDTKLCIFRELRDRSRVKTKSKVCPWLCVGPETCCTRLKDLQMFKKSVANGFEVLSIWMFKSPAIMALSNLSTRKDMRSENSVRKSLLEFKFGGR